MIVQITTILKQSIDNPKVKFILLRSSGKRAFCAGGDIKALQDASLAHLFFEQEFNLNRLIFRYPKPIIALLHGVVMGGGVGISIYASHRIVCANSNGRSTLQFAMPETSIGLFTDIGASYFLPKLCTSLPLAQYIAITGVRLNEVDCAYCNVLTHYIDDESLSYDQLVPLLRQMKVQDCHSRQQVETVLDQTLQKFSIQRKFAQQSQLFALQDTIDQIFDVSQVEQALANLQLLASSHIVPPTIQKWAKQTLSLLQTKCPTSIKVTFESLKRGRNSTLEQVLQSDYRLGVSMVARNDFRQGVDAVVVRKDFKAQWEPSTLEQVTPQFIQQLFDEPRSKELSFGSTKV